MRVSLRHFTTDPSSVTKTYLALRTIPPYSGCMARRIASALVAAVLFFVPVSPLISAIFDSGTDMPCCKGMHGRCCHHSKNSAGGASWNAAASCPNQCGQTPGTESGFGVAVASENEPAVIYVAAGAPTTFQAPAISFAYDPARYQRPPPVA